MKTVLRSVVWIAALIQGQAALGCSSGDKPPVPEAAPSGEQSGKAVPPTMSAPSASTTPTKVTTEPAGDAESGKKLVAEHQCARCHDGLDEVPAIADERHCTKCHQNVMAGKFDHKPDHEKWRKNVAHLVAVPSLTAAGQRLRYGWLVEYLMNPHDVRPNLEYDMPRLRLEREQARDIATYLRSLAKEETAELDLAGADLDAGKKLLTDKGCGSCHTMSHTDAFADAPKQVGDLRVALMLAPDLRHARKRLRPEAILAWLENPLKMKPGTLMPQTPMNKDEAKNIVAYLMKGPVQPFTPPAVPALPKPLDRKVKFDEVNEKIFAKICRHCHGNPDEGVGDGGPGNTGGFGFPPRGLELTSYKRVMAGYTDDAGERHSVFKKTNKGVPRIVASLMARHGEKLGVVDPEVRGMPMGLPPLPIADIQLLVTWIEQGRRR